MRRVIYSPSGGDISIAENLAKLINLPIQIGDSESTCRLSFDRDQTQIVNIPTNHEINFLEKSLVGETIWININTDLYDLLKNKIYCDLASPLSHEKIYPQITEQHYARFLHNPKIAGEYIFTFYIDEDEIFKTEILVV